MPELSRFYGIIVTMYYNDHPPPHFHARYGKNKALIEIENLAILEGDMPNNARRMLQDWGRAHRDELLVNWERARLQQALLPIEPLE